MLNNVLLIVTSIFIPVFIFISLHLYNYKNYNKLSKILIITTLSLELFRFFYNASFYDQAKTPSGYLTFSYITFLIVFGLFAVYNNSKLGGFFKKTFMLTSLVPTVFALFASRVYLSQMVEVEGVLQSLDKYSVLPCLYFIECGLLITLGILFLLDNRFSSVKELSLNMVYSLGVYAIYTLISIATKYAWEIEYSYDLSFYLSIFIPVLSIVVVYLGSLFISKKLSNVVESK